MSGSDLSRVTLSRFRNIPNVIKRSYSDWDLTSMICFVFVLLLFGFFSEQLKLAHAALHSSVDLCFHFSRKGMGCEGLSAEFNAEIVKGLPAEAASTCLHMVFLRPSQDYVSLIFFVMGGDRSLNKHLRDTSPPQMEFG